MLPHLSPATADALRTALLRTGYTTDGVRALLGTAAHAALGRGEVEPAFRATRDGGELGVLVRLLLLGAVEPDAAVAAALAPLAPADAAAAGLLREASDGWAAELDLRPYGDTRRRLVGVLRPRPAPPGARPRHRGRVPRR